MPPPPAPEEPTDLFSSDDDVSSNSSVGMKPPLIKMYNKDYMAKKNSTMKPRQVVTCCMYCVYILFEEMKFSNDNW